MRESARSTCFSHRVLFIGVLAADLPGSPGLDPPLTSAGEAGAGVAAYETLAWQPFEDAVVASSTLAKKGTPGRAPRAQSQQLAA